MSLIGRSSSGPTQTLTLSAVAQGLSVPPGTSIALVAIEGGSARWTDDGVPPAVSRGQPMADGERMFFGSAATLQLIAISGSPTVTASYYR